MNCSTTRQLLGALKVGDAPNVESAFRDFAVEHGTTSPDALIDEGVVPARWKHGAMLSLQRLLHAIADVSRDEQPVREARVKVTRDLSALGLVTRIIFELGDQLAAFDHWKRNSAARSWRAVADLNTTFVHLNAKLNAEAITGNTFDMQRAVAARIKRTSGGTTS